MLVYLPLSLVGNVPSLSPRASMSQSPTMSRLAGGVIFPPPRPIYQHDILIRNQVFKAKSFTLTNLIYVFHLLGGRIFPLQLINILNKTSTLAQLHTCTLHTAHCTVAHLQMFNCAKHKVPVSFSAALDSVTPGHNPRN